MSLPVPHSNLLLWLPALFDMPYPGVRLLWVLKMATADRDCILTPVDR